ncbi:MAG: hypothetical protein RR410_08330 [Alistipes sp.]
MKWGMRHRSMIVVAIVALFATSCVSPHASVVTDVNPDGWTDRATMTYCNADTTSLCDMNLFLRCDDSFAEDTLTVRFAICTPDSLRFEEPFRLVLPHTNSPAALRREVVVTYRHRVRLLRAGNYYITITPVRPVQGVEAVGVTLSM